MRERSPREGEIVQVDGSDHLWFENRGKRCTLLVDIDDAKNPEIAHRPPIDGHDLETIFTIKQDRRLSKNLTLQYKNKLYQIVSDRQSYTLRHAQVVVSENDVGRVRIFYKGKELKYTIHDFQEKQGITVDSKHLNQEVDSIVKKPRNIPSKHHPWRKRSWRRPVFSQ